MTLVRPATRRHTVELWTPKALGIARRRVIEIGSNRRSKRIVCQCSHFVCSQCTVIDGNVVHQSAERVDEERTCLQFRSILANPEVGSGVLHIRTAHATCTDCVAIQIECTFVASLVEHHSQHIPLSTFQFLASVNREEITVSIGGTKLETEVALRGHLESESLLSRFVEVATNRGVCRCVLSLSRIHHRIGFSSEHHTNGQCRSTETANRQRSLHEVGVAIEAKCHTIGTLHIEGWQL